MHNDSRVIGKLYGIGLGPGDPELLTLKSVKIIKKVDIIFVPKSGIKNKSVAMEIIKSALNTELCFKEIIFPMIKDKNTLIEYWINAAKTIYAELEKGLTVAFVTLGDVSIYSTFAYLYEAIREINNNIELELLPGISSIQLLAAKTQKPLSIGDGTFAVYPLPEDLSSIKDFLSVHMTIVLMKVSDRLQELKKFIFENQLQNNSSFIRRGGFHDEIFVSNFNEISDEDSGYLSTVMITRGVVE